MKLKYELPSFLPKEIEQSFYSKWLDRKARSHVKRDRERLKKYISIEEYKSKIHEAVLKSEGKDYYTNEYLDWLSISPEDGGKIKRLPSVDHEFLEGKIIEFRICSWQTNDCKNDLTYNELITFCETILKNRKI